MMLFAKFKKSLTVIALVSAALFLFFYFVVQNTYFTIDTGSGDSKTDMTVSYIDKNGVSPRVSPLFGVYMIPRASDVIVIKQGGQEIRKFIPNRLLIGFNHLQASLQPQKQVSKIGQGGLDCNGKVSESRYFSYSCFDATNDVFAFANKAAGQYENRQIQSESSDTRLSTKPYKNGLLSVVRVSGLPSLQYLDTTNGKVKTVTLDNKSVDSIILYVSSVDDSFVVIDNYNHQMTFFGSLIDSPRNFKISEDIIYSSCDVSSRDILCAATSGETLGVNEEGAHDAANLERVKDSKILRYDVKNNKQSNYPTERLVDKICLTKDGVYSLEDDEKLYYYPGESGRQSLISAGTKSIACGGDSIIYTDGSSIFGASNGDANLLFKEERFRVSNIQFLLGDIVFTSYLNSEEQPTLLAYKVTQKGTGSQRIESVLPYVPDNDMPVLEMDYDDKNIYIKPQLSITSDRQANRTIIDEDALAKTKQIIEAKLSEDNLLDKYSLVYYYN